VISRTSCGITFLLGAALAVRAQVVTARSETFVPAGTILACTIDEPDFSSKTAGRGDPLLCKTTSSVEMFGRPLIPRGSYLSANLQDYRDPGRLVGKGWIELEFTSLTVPDGSVPLDGRVISAGRYRVSVDGKIQGRGHPVRDAVEWAVPVLWPIKLLTLPARGPRPTLKGETRIELRLMEDLPIPQSGDPASDPPMPTPPPAPLAANDRIATRDVPWTSTPIALQPEPVTRRERPSAPHPHPTLLAMRNGQIFMAADYWRDHGNLAYLADGEVQVLPLDALDPYLSWKLNAERGVLFTLVGKNR
jgi:hypothetical protein